MRRSSNRDVIDQRLYTSKLLRNKATLRQSVSLRELAATSYLRGRMDFIITLAMANLCVQLNSRPSNAPINVLPHRDPPPIGQHESWGFDMGQCQGNTLIGA